MKQTNKLISVEPFKFGLHMQFLWKYISCKFAIW